MQSLFDRFTIKGSDDIIHKGIKPSLIPKPFKFVKIVCLNGKEIYPKGSPFKDSELIAGYDTSIKVITNILSTQEKPTYFFRLITLYLDGSKWSELYSLDGNLYETEWL